MEQNYKQNLTWLFHDYLIWQKTETNRLIQEDQQENQITDLIAQLDIRRYLSEELNYTKKESDCIIQEFKNTYKLFDTQAHETRKDQNSV